MKSFKKEAFMFMCLGISPECMSVQDVHAVPAEGEEGPLEMEGQTDARGSVGAEN